MKMSQQTTLTKYFPSKAAAVQINTSMCDKNNKRRSLSLKKPANPSKSPGGSSDDVILVKEEHDIITLSSDSDHEGTPAKRPNIKLPSEIQTPNSNTDASNSSETTFVYNLSPSSILNKSPSTPSKKTHTPGSSAKFYSPTKKRTLKKKSPAKRNLAQQFNEDNIEYENSIHKTLDDIFAPFENIVSTTHTYKDDKTEFLLSIIDKYLKSGSLKHLLKEHSQELLEKCMSVVNPGMRLICRLYWCQSRWYRLDELGRFASGKKEVLSSPDLHNMISSLVGYGLITPGGSEGESKMDFEDYVKLLKKPDLQQICKELKLKVQSKQNAVDALRCFSKQAPISNFYTGKGNNNRTRVLEILKSKTGHCYKMSEVARTTFYNLYVLMYFGMNYSLIREKRLELILLHDKIRREPYPIDKDMVIDDASVMFQNQEEFYRYLQAHMLYENYLEQTDTNEKCEIIKQSFMEYKEVGEDLMLRYKSLPTWLRKFTPPNMYIKILENGIQELKKLKTDEYYKLAVDILDALISQIAFRQHKKAEWYAEKALILHTYLDSSEQAAKVLLEGFKSDMSEEIKDAMRPRAKKIANQQNIDLKEALREELGSYATKETILESNLPADHIYKQPKDNYNQKGKLKFEMYTSSGKTTVTAEDYCVAHYLSQGQYESGEHWEGRIVTTIFFLLFWDIIYSKPRGVTGIFMSHYQRYPLDMFTESFYINRKTLVDERLMFIQETTEEQLLQVMKTKWDERPESEVSDIQRNIGWEVVRDVTSCLHPRGVAAICRRLATNYGYARSGFPDLTLWNLSTRKIKFVEVKTDADKPSVKQLQWLQYLLDHNIDAGFCYIGVNTTRSKARSMSSQNN